MPNTSGPAAADTTATIAAAAANATIAAAATNANVRLSNYLHQLLASQCKPRLCLVDEKSHQLSSVDL